MSDDSVFSPISRDRAFEAVVRQIEAAILDGTYKAGDYLPSERALVEQFRVGRSTVREALRILESMGLVKTSPGSRKGVKVAASMTQSMSRMLNGAIRVEGVPLVDLVEYRMMTGATGNFLAAHQRTDEHLAAMAEAIAEMEAQADDPSAFARADAAFHTAIQHAAGNSLMRMINGVVEAAIVDLIEGTIATASENEGMRRRFIEHHAALYDAIRDRRGDEAARIARVSLLEVYGASLSEPERRRLALLAGVGVVDFGPAEE